MKIICASPSGLSLYQLSSRSEKVVLRAPNYKFFYSFMLYKIYLDVIGIGPEYYGNRQQINKMLVNFLDNDVQSDIYDNYPNQYDNNLESVYDADKRKRSMFRELDGEIIIFVLIVFIAENLSIYSI
jgi:hypothetical protein